MLLVCSMCSNARLDDRGCYHMLLNLCRWSRILMHGMMANGATRCSGMFVDVVGCSQMSVSGISVDALECL